MNDPSEIPQINTAIRVSCGESKFDNCPLQLEVASFDEFADAILVGRGTVKGKAFICAPMAEGFNNNQVKYPGKKTWRAKHLALPRWFAPFDLDGFDSVDTYRQVLAFLERYQGFAYTTASHTPEAPRCRVVLMQTRATDREEGIAVCTAVQAGIERALGVGRVTFDQKVYPGEQPLYTPLEGAETFRFTGAPVNVETMLMQAPPAKKKATSKTKLEQVQSDDKILQAMVTLDMVRSTEDGERYMIECPFAHEHSMDGGDKETMYCLANTHGHAQANFSCFHSHCSRRSQSEFQIEVLAKLENRTGTQSPITWPAVKTTAAVEDADNSPDDLDDIELDSILADATEVMKAYMEWQKENAFRVHPTFALCSALLFIQAFIGRNVRLPRDLRVNLWMLLFAPSESGKGAALRAAEEALKELSDKKIFPAVLHFANRFGSAEGMLWKFAKVSQVIWTNDEMLKELIGMMAAPQGSPAYNKATLLMEMHDAATKPFIAPIDYSGHDKRTKDMPPLEYAFFSAVGSGVTRNIGLLNAAATTDGMLNRFLPFVVEGLPPIGSGRPQTPLPDAVVKWATAIQAEKFVEFFNPDTPPAVGQPKVLEVYPGFYEDWQRECQHGAEMAQELPGVWGRYAEKVLQVTMLHALSSGVMKVTPEGFAWAVRLVRWAVAKFAAKFAGEGGGALDNTGKLRNALLAFFQKDKAIRAHQKMGYLSSSFLAQYCRAWKEYIKERTFVVRALTDEGVIIEIDLEHGGKGYRLRGTPQHES